jgi:SAM-dependent methyltransferase
VVPTESASCALCDGLDCAQPYTSGWDFEYDTTRQEFPFVRCRRHGHIFLSVRPAAAAMSTIYPSTYYSFSESGAGNAFVEAVRARLEAAKVRGLLAQARGPVRAALDIGCGDGRLLTILRRHGPPGLRLDGIEICEQAAARARSAGFTVTTGDFDSPGLRAPGEAYDLALMHQLIEHLRSPRSALQAVRSRLRPGGVLSIETPDIDAWDADLFQHRHWGGYHLPRHFHIFNRAALRALLEQEGFEILRVRALPSPVFWILSVRNRLIDSGVPARRLGWIHYQNPALLAVATVIDLMQISGWRRSSNQQVWARRG